MNELAIFAKYWSPGAVKTRLAKTLGAEAAAQIYHAFLKALLQRCESFDLARSLAFAPLERRDEFTLLAGDAWLLWPQSEGDLGMRMQNYFASAFQRGVDRVVLIGSDSPHLPLEYITNAFDRLRETQVVLGPSTDGGYYLIGISADASQVSPSEIPEIFSSIDWGSEQVWQQTIERLEATETDYQVLPTWYDVDDEADLVRLVEDLDRADHGLSVPIHLDPPLQELRQRIGQLWAGPSSS